MENTFGVQLRNDWVHNGLFRTENRVRTDKYDINACNDEPYGSGGPIECLSSTTLNPVGAVLPSDTDLSKFTDTIGSVYVENKIQWASKFRSVVALRGDDAKYVVTNLNPTYVSNIPSLSSTPVNFAQANSGSASKFLPQPKASLIFGPWAKTEFYAQGGFSFHSNDARGATQTMQPISPDNPFPTSCAKITPLVQTKGGEIGVRISVVPHLQSTVALWYLRSNSELMQDGDTGGTSASEQSSNRYGLEWANYYTPTEHLAIDFDIADSRAQFTQIDPDDAAQSVVKAALSVNGTPYGTVNWQESGQGGKLVPEAVKVVISSGATLHDLKGFTSSLRLRYFGPRPLTSDGLYQSNQTVLLNGELGYQFNKKWHFTTELLNMLNRKDADIDYAYVYQIAPTAAPAFGRVNHPTEPLLVRFALGRSF